MKEAVLGDPAPFWGGHQGLLYTDQGHLMWGYSLLNGHRGQRFDENHGPLLQSQGTRQWTGQGVGTLWSLRCSKCASWAGAGDQTEVLQGEVQDGRTGTVEAVGLLGGLWRSCVSGSLKPKVGGRNLLGWGRSGACSWCLVDVGR